MLPSDLDPMSVPVGSKAVSNDTRYVKTTFTRVSEQVGLAEWFHPTRGTLILKVRIVLPTGASQVEYLDHGFWKFTVDGRPLPAGTAGQAQGAMSIDAQTRTINFKTR
jgi:hypothetical protein